MLITYLRSSSIANYDYCQMQYFINYVLGWNPPSGHKANKGTVVHAVMERLAKIKLAIQHGQDRIEDDILGSFSFVESDLLSEYQLKDLEVDKINSTRINKNTYLSKADISYGHTRYGREIVKETFDKVYEWYKEHTQTEWANIDRVDCENWVWMILDYKNGLYDPRRRTIKDVEKSFDIALPHEWAKFDYGNIRGQLGIKGTIDLIIENDCGTLEAIDWKTGQRLNWASMKEKKYKDFTSDTQLMLYFYAIKQLYGVEGIMSTIFYVRDGGPFSVVFDEDTVPIIEKRLMDRFNEIRKNTSPQLLDPTRKNFKCKTLCHYAKTKWDGTNKCMCEFIKSKIDTVGIDEVVQKYSRSGHSIDHYQSPGDV